MTLRLLPLHRAAATTGALVAALALAACGGGGGDDEPSPATPAFDAGTYGQTADVLAAAVLDDAAAGSLPLELIGRVVDAQAQALAAGGRRASADPLAVWRRFAAPGGDASRVRALAAVPFQEACPGGGTLSGSVDDADNDGELSAGDALSLVATNCVIDDEATLHGGVAMRIDAYTWRQAPYRETATIAIDFDNLAAAGVRMDGAATLSADFTDLRSATSVVYAGTTRVDTAHTLRLDYRVDAAIDHTVGDGTLALSGAVVVDGQRLTLTQRMPFHLSATDLLPDAGTLEASEAQGARLQVVAAADRFGYRYFAPANAGTTPDASAAGRAIRTGP